MRSVIRLSLIAGCLASTALSVALSPASAGGPTSVLIVNPTNEATASLYTTDATYARLLDALKPASVGTRGEKMPANLRGGPGTSAINVTWLVHDVIVWRVDRIQLGSDGDLWVQTAQSLTDGELWNSERPWRTPAESDRLLMILDQLGVLGGEPATEATGPASEVTYDATRPATDRVVATPQGPDTDAGSGEAWPWWWLLPGVAMGVAIGALSRPYAAAMLNRRERGPRQQLIDV